MSGGKARSVDHPSPGLDILGILLNIKSFTRSVRIGPKWSGGPIFPHLGLIGQRKYTWTWQNLKKKTYQAAGIWVNVITTDETNGINPRSIEQLIELIIADELSTEDKHNQYSNHHYYLR